MRATEVASTFRLRRGGAGSPARRSGHGRFGGRSGWALIALGISLAAAPLHAQDWPMFRGDATHSGIAQGSLALPLSLQWRHVTQHPLTGVNPSSPILVGSGTPNAQGFFVARDLVAAVHPDTGAAKWYYPSSGYLGAGGKQATVRTTPLYVGGVVYVGASDGHLYAISTQNGTLLWDYPSGPSAVTTSPINVGGQVYFGTATGSIIGLNARTGKPLAADAELFKAADAIVGSIAYADGFLYFVSRDQNAYALDLSRALAPTQGRRPRRVIRWSYNLSSPPTAYASPVIHNEFLYLADGESLSALTLTRGRRRWTFPAESIITDSPAVTDQGIFFGSRDGTFYSLTSDGKLRWKSELAGPSYSSPVVVRISTAGAGTPRYGVFVGANRGFVYGFDTGFGTESTADDGKLLWVYRVRPADPAVNQTLNVIASPVVFDNKLYVLVDDGSLLAFSSGAPDVTAPIVWGESPDRSVEISGRPPINYLVNVADDGSGINPDTIVMRVDDRAVDFTYDEYRGLIYYKFAAAAAGNREPVQPLPAGRRKVHVEVADWKGNRTVRDWSFLVNTNISDVRSVAPPAAP